MASMSYIPGMNIQSLDLNLLTALDALVETGSVTAAAQRLGISQPAASHMLRRLREALGDPLLVRVGASMRLTPRAEALREPLRRTLDDVRGLFAPPGFDPSASNRRFVLMMPDLVAELVLPPLVEAVAAEAPDVRLELTPWRAPHTVGDDLGREVDLVLSCVGDAYPGFHRQKLYGDRDALAVRRGRRAAADLQDLERFRAARHIAVISHGAREDMIDPWLRRHGVERRIALVVPTYVQALRMASRTDLVAFVPRRLIDAYAALFRLQAVTPPIDPGVDEQFLFHPTTANTEPGSVWLRNLVLRIGRALEP